MSSENQIRPAPRPHREIRGTRKAPATEADRLRAMLADDEDLSRAFGAGRVRR